MVTFYVANNIDEAASTDMYLSLPENLHSFFYDEFSFDQDMNLINELSFFAHETIFERDKIKSFLQLSKRFKHYNGINKKSVNRFFYDLEKMCVRAIEENKSLIAVGD